MKSMCFSKASWVSTLIFLSRSQSGLAVLIAERLKVQRPCASPRSIAITVSCVPW